MPAMTSETGFSPYANQGGTEVPVYLGLEIAGNEIQGESQQQSHDRENNIECLSFEYELAIRRDSAGRPTRGRQHGPIIITKLIDKSSPLLFKALCQNEPVSGAEFRFFRPDMSGAGAEEHFYTVRIDGGSVASVKQIGHNSGHPMEEVTFVFQNITWTYEDGNVTHQDSAGRLRA